MRENLFGNTRVATQYFACITYATIEIPAPASARNRNAQERSFLQWRQTEMRHRYKQGEAKRARSGPHDPDKVSHDQKGRLIH